MQKNILLKTFVFLFLSACSPHPFAWWKSINEKAQHLSSLEARFSSLEEEHEKLKVEYFKLEHEHNALLAEVKSKESADLNLKLTGSKEGRAIASISYSPPKGLKPQQLFDLAYEHFREKRFAESAATFDELMASPEAASLQTAGMFYTAGVAWFKIKNYQKAKENFEVASHHAEGDEKEKIRKKVELWLRAISSNLKPADEDAHGGSK